MVHILSFVGHLEAGTTHSEVHAVHVNLTRVGLTISSFCEVCVLVLEDRYLDVHLFLASFVYRLGQTKEAGMRARCLLWDKVLMGVLV